MQTNRADRFEQELRVLAAQKIELERENAQLKNSIQVRDDKHCIFSIILSVHSIMLK